MSTALSRVDSEFLVKAHQSNLAEISASRLAEHRATRQDIRSTARRLIADHLRLDAAVRRLAVENHVKLPGSPSSTQNNVMSSLDKLSGARFDAAWVHTQIVGHEETLRLVRHQIRAGHAPAVVAAARSAEPVIIRHLRMLRALPVPTGTSSPGMT